VADSKGKNELMFKAPEHLRRVTPVYSDASHGNNGYFRAYINKRSLLIIASDQMGWEHVSASLPDRCPTWDEMSRIKDLFWSPEDLVIQFHPPKTDYVNNHPFVLHLWRKSGTNDFCERPPVELV
jgi:hypothetical protein